MPSSSTMPLSPDPPFLCTEDASEVTSDHHHPPSPFPDSDEAAIAGLLDAETHHMPEKDYLRRCRDRSVDVTARLDAVNWILKVHAFYEFSPVTAFLSVNYLDRFLSRCSLPPKFVFEPKTVQRMELWVMSNLKWRLRSVTPFDYLHYFFTKLPSSSSQSITTASNLILSTTRVINFLGFAPSTVAAAAVQCSANGQLPLSFHDRLNSEMVRCCHQLMEEYVVDTCPASIKVRITEAAAPSSPVGVLDAATCGSCDTPSERNFAGSAEEQAEPPNKRLRSSASDAPRR
ncbi:hypothetical protein AAZV13_20G101800 [Glycine max]|uniref:B-like cyclin n=1 Tax=Glycine max TaxID=3847 RepID=A0A0R0EAV8_SOYBN